MEPHWSANFPFYCLSSDGPGKTPTRTAFSLLAKMKRKVQKSVLFVSQRTSGSARKQLSMIELTLGCLSVFQYFGTETVMSKQTNLLNVNSAGETRSQSNTFTQKYEKYLQSMLS